MKDELAILTIAAIFLVLVSIISILITASFRAYSMKRDRHYEKQIERITQDVSELKSLFKNEISDVFTQIKEVIK